MSNIIRFDIDLAKNSFAIIAICEAAGRPSMRFIPVKSKEQQAVLLVHRLRRACVAKHTRIVNRLRGFLAEFGIVAPKGADAFKARWKAIRQEHDQDLPALAWAGLLEQWIEDDSSGSSQSLSVRRGRGPHASSRYPGRCAKARP